MKFLQKYTGTSIGRKLLVALSSIGLILFLIIHLSGNLLIFAGPEAFNTYAHTLHSFPKLLWMARISILIIFITHWGIGLYLRMENKRARPNQYRYQNTIQASVASRTMALTGLIMLSYIVYHILHFTLGKVHSQYFNTKDELLRHDVYSMVVFSFQQPLIVVTYLISLFLTMVHLSHGIPSLFQTVGLLNSNYHRLINILGKAFAILLFSGYASIPISVFIGFIHKT